MADWDHVKWCWADSVLLSIVWFWSVDWQLLSWLLFFKVHSSALAKCYVAYWDCQIIRFWTTRVLLHVKLSNLSIQKFCNIAPNYKLIIILRFIIPVVFNKLTRLECMYLSNTTLFDGGDISSIYYIRYNYMFRCLAMANFRLYRKYLVSSYTRLIMGCIQWGGRGWGGHEISYVSWRLKGVGTWSFCYSAIIFGINCIKIVS